MSFRVQRVSFGILQILVWTCLMSRASRVCQEVSGDSIFYDYFTDREDFYPGSVEFSLCCNRTTLEVSWMAEPSRNGFKYVTSLEYVCSRNRKGMLSGKSSFTSNKNDAAIEGSDNCTATLMYEDLQEEVYELTLTCSVPKDLCLTNPCGPNEICYNKDENFTCTCPKNFNNNCTACENGYQFSKNRSECSCQDGEVRLVNGSSAQEGLIELCMNNQYSGIADSSWGMAEAGVVCRQLGFSHDSEPLYYNAETNSSVVLSRVHCSGNESSLINCIWNGTNSSDINYSRRVGVKCDVYRSTQAELNLDTTRPLKTSSVKSMELVEASCGALAVLLLVGLTMMSLILLFHKRCCSHRDHKVEVQKCFEQELDVGFAPVDFKFDIPASSSLHSVTTVVCPMEKEDFTKIELETQLSPVIERYTIPNVIQIP